MADRYTGKTFLRAVGVKGQTVLYGFRTTLEDAKATALGQVAAATATGALLPNIILGANSPKPPRAFKKRVTGETDSSFVNYETIDEARGAGWTIKPGSITIPRTTKVSFPVYVTIDTGTVAPDAPEGTAAPNYKYGWRMQKAQRTILEPSFGDLGITPVTLENFDGVWFGVNTPKPFRVARALDTGSTISTFISTNKIDTIVGTAAAPTGWYIVSGKAAASSFGI